MIKLIQDRRRGMRIVRRVYIALGLIMTTSVIAFAGVENAGQNAGEWATTQLWYVALAVVVFMFVKFLIKKAWVPAGIFIAIAGILLYLVQNPEQLQRIGESLFGIIFK